MKQSWPGWVAVGLVTLLVVIGTWVVVTQNPHLIHL